MLSLLTVVLSSAVRCCRIHTTEQLPTDHRWYITEAGGCQLSRCGDKRYSVINKASYHFLHKTLAWIWIPWITACLSVSPNQRALLLVNTSGNMFVPRCLCHVVCVTLFVSRCLCHVVCVTLFVSRCLCHVVCVTLFVSRCLCHGVCGMFLCIDYLINVI